MTCPSCNHQTDTGNRCYNPECKLQDASLVSSDPGYQHRARPIQPQANVFGSPVEQAIFCREFLIIFQEIADHLKALSDKSAALIDSNNVRGVE